MSPGYTCVFFPFATFALSGAIICHMLNYSTGYECILICRVFVFYSFRCRQRLSAASAWSFGNEWMSKGDVHEWLSFFIFFIIKTVGRWCLLHTDYLYLKDYVLYFFFHKRNLINWLSPVTRSQAGIKLNCSSAVLPLEGDWPLVRAAPLQQNT